jgi:hypothetical protein
MENCFLPDGIKMGNVKNTPEVIISGDTKQKHKPVSFLKRFPVLILLNLPQS